MMSRSDLEALEVLEDRLRTLLPEEYQDSYEEVQPVSMGSAGLKYDAAGAVAWDEMWESFCDLAMAGGPPHKGRLLEPATPAAIDAEPDRYRAVVTEICRGIDMVTDLPVHPSESAGWVSVGCNNESMAGWLLRAVVIENVAARAEGSVIELPAGPTYRLEKEIKNVITVAAKTTHYWLGHIGPAQQRAVGNLFTRMHAKTPLVEPAFSGDGADAGRHGGMSLAVAEAIGDATGLRPSSHRYEGWLGLECPSVPIAVWMMRALVASNVLSRREETVLFVPINEVSDPGGSTVTRLVALTYRLALGKGLP